MPKPVITNPPAPARAPVLKEKAEPPKLWVFSFRFFRQIEYFGLDQSGPKWFVSVLDKLQSLSSEPLETFLSDPAKRDVWRYHEIDWNQKNIPVQREDLNWLSPDYRKNATEFPIVQFQISLALGRVIGFFDESNTFQVVLLDPLHNMQPAKAYDYRVDPCSPLFCEFTDLRERVLEIQTESLCDEEGCPIIQKLAAVDELKNREPYNILMFRADDYVLKEADRLIQGGLAKSHTEIFETGILQIQESNASPREDGLHETADAPQAHS